MVVEWGKALRSFTFGSPFPSFHHSNFMPVSDLTRTRTRTNTNPNDTKASAAGRRGVRVRSANGSFENQGAWAAKCPTVREALVGGVHSGNAHRKAPDLRNTKFHYSRGQKRLFSEAPCALPPGKCPSSARTPSSAFRVTVKRGGPKNRHHASGPLVA